MLFRLLFNGEESDGAAADWFVWFRDVKTDVVRVGVIGAFCIFGKFIEASPLQKIQQRRNENWKTTELNEACIKNIFFFLVFLLVMLKSFWWRLISNIFFENIFHRLNYYLLITIISWFFHHITWVIRLCVFSLNFIIYFINIAQTLI